MELEGLRLLRRDRLWVVDANGEKGIGGGLKDRFEGRSPGAKGNIGNGDIFEKFVGYLTLAIFLRLSSQ